MTRRFALTVIVLGMTGGWATPTRAGLMLADLQAQASVLNVNLTNAQASLNLLGVQIGNSITLYASRPAILSQLTAEQSRLAQLQVTASVQRSSLTTVQSQLAVLSDPIPDSTLSSISAQLSVLNSNISQLQANTATLNGDYGTTLAAATAVPEPSSLALCGFAGVSGLGLAWRRKRASAVA